MRAGSDMGPLREKPGNKEGRWMTFRVDGGRRKRETGQSMKSLGSRWRTDGDEWQRRPYQTGAATQDTANSLLCALRRVRSASGGALSAG